ncbi:unnamed protein product [Caenorhabditis nigoni]
MLPYSENILEALLESEAPLFLVVSWFLILLKVFESDQKLKILYQEKEELLRILWEKTNPEDSDDEDYQLPYFSDSEEEDESGYNTDPDREWELYKIYHAPAGPVPLNQVYLTFTCQFTDLYVKAVVDKDHSLIHILSYDRNQSNQLEWMETKCWSCIDKVRRVLADGGCNVPFAMDTPDVMESESDDDDVISVIEMSISPRP